jgi:hypothetical protein
LRKGKVLGKQQFGKNLVSKTKKIDLFNELLSQKFYTLKVEIMNMEYLLAKGLNLAG